MVFLWRIFILYNEKYIGYGSCETLDLEVISVIFTHFLDKQNPKELV